MGTAGAAAAAGYLFSKQNGRAGRTPSSARSSCRPLEAGFNICRWSGSGDLQRLVWSISRPAPELPHHFFLAFRGGLAKRDIVISGASESNA